MFAVFYQMPNSFFRFKQFTVQQERCAMKVCTDSCLFGAYVADSISKAAVKPKHILDIGTGTGLLSLMIAQQSNAVIDAVEINEEAHAQALDNFRHSPWQPQLNLYKEDINHFAATQAYDCIISNPPFYENDLKSTATGRNAAMHSTSLTLQQLLLAIKKLLTQQGEAWLLLPYQRTDYTITEAAAQGLFVREKLLIKQTDLHPYFRSILRLSQTAGAITEKSISIKNKEDKYSNDFIQLLKDYYLYL